MMLAADAALITDFRISAIASRSGPLLAGHLFHGTIGTLETALYGEPLTILSLIAR
jgi:hypothetical protein